MSDQEGDQGVRSELGSTSFSGGSSFTTTGTVFRSSEAVGNQEWTLEYGQWAIDYEAAVHQREEEKKDNDLRRLCFRIILGLLVAALVAGALAGAFSDDPGTRQWAQNIVTTLIGGLLGAVAGYFSGRSAR